MVRDTSRLALIQESDKIPQSQSIILKLLTGVGRPLTDREIALALGFSDPNKVRPRRKELLDAGMIRDCGKRFCSVSFKLAYCWAPTDENNVLIEPNGQTAIKF